jgi:hypothetical protein
VKVIRHETKGQQPYWDFRQSVTEASDELFVIVMGFKEPKTSRPAIDDVKDIASRARPHARAVNKNPASDPKK